MGNRYLDMTFVIGNRYLDMTFVIRQPLSRYDCCNRSTVFRKSVIVVNKTLFIMISASLPSVYRHLKRIESLFIYLQMSFDAISKNKRKDKQDEKVVLLGKHAQSRGKVYVKLHGDVYTPWVTGCAVMPNVVLSLYVITTMTG